MFVMQSFVLINYLMTMFLNILFEAKFASYQEDVMYTLNHDNYQLGY